MLPQRMPNPDTTGPLTGQMIPLEPPLTGPAAKALAGASCSAIFA